MNTSSLFLFSASMRFLTGFTPHRLALSAWVAYKSGKVPLKDGTE